MKFPLRRKKTPPNTPGPDSPGPQPAHTQTRPRPAQSPALARSQLAHDLGRLLALGEGQRYLARLIAVSGALAPSYSPGGAQATAYNEGLRRMGLFILAEAEEHCPEALPRLLLLSLPCSGGQTAPLQ